VNQICSLCRFWFVWLSFVIAFGLPLVSSSNIALADFFMCEDVDWGVYDSDPHHSWNQVHRVLFERKAPNGSSHGCDQLAPTDLLESAYSHSEIIETFDRFIVSGHKEISNPVVRAVMQNDLWTVFDWTINKFD